ncbi:MAG: acetyltransferase [Culturomica sp.]|jgi:sugar O-acyltransferase (sialic acid O-acetyltransferase NeuD family)|nr:acetyltransferase [Culturomica sp.]
MNDRKLILVGGGGHCKSVIDVAESSGWTILGILDVVENVGKKVLDYTVIGTDDQIPEFVDTAYFLVTVGQIKNTGLRIKLHEKIGLANGKLATVIASDAHVSKHSNVDKGTVVMHKAVVNAGVKIGEGCIINTFANIEHDVEIGNYCHISTGAMVNGDCMVGSETFVGSGVVVANGVSIAECCTIAAGSVVRKKILVSGIYAGNPAIRYK